MSRTRDVMELRAFLPASVRFKSRSASKSSLTEKLPLPKFDLFPSTSTHCGGDTSRTVCSLSLAAKWSPVIGPATNAAVLDARRADQRSGFGSPAVAACLLES
jgi:hypothetical protein